MYQFLKEPPKQEILWKDLYNISNPHFGFNAYQITILLYIYVKLEDFTKVKKVLKAYTTSSDSMEDIESILRNEIIPIVKKFISIEHVYLIESLTNINLSNTPDTKYIHTKESNTIIRESSFNILQFFCILGEKENSSYSEIIAKLLDVEFLEIYEFHLHGRISIFSYLLHEDPNKYINDNLQSIFQFIEPDGNIPSPIDNSISSIEDLRYKLQYIFINEAKESYILSEPIKIENLQYKETTDDIPF